MKKVPMLSLLIIIVVMMVGLANCKKDQPIPPVLTTTAPDHIYATIATSGGNILSEGSSTVLRRGVCWSLNNTPTITNDTTFNGVGAGKFESHLKGLNYNATYFVRAYAINADGVGYGDAMSFKTPMAKVPTISYDFYGATNITATSATTSSFSTTSDIGVPILSRGVCWSVLTNISSNYTYTSPTILDNKAEAVALYYNNTYAATMTGLTENTLYIYRPYATNAVGAGYGGARMFMTPPLLPTTVHIESPYLVEINGRSQYIANVTIPTVNNIQNIFSYGANWSTTPHPVATDNQYSVIGSPAIYKNSYTVNLVGLPSRTLYYVRAWVNYNTPTGHNLVYSNEEWFFTQ